MDKLVISGEGYPGSNEYLAFAEKSSHDMISAIVKALGNNVIIDGMIDTAGTISAGSLIYNNEILPFISGTLATTVVIVEEVTSAGYDTSGTGDFSDMLPISKVRYAKFGTLGDPNVVDSFAFTVLSRIDNLQSANNRLRFLKSGTASIVYPESDPNYAVATGEYLDAEILFGGSSTTFTRLKITFSALAVGYEPLINVDVSEGGFNGSQNITIYEQTNNSLTIDIKKFNATGYSGYITKLNIKLIG